MALLVITPALALAAAAGRSWAPGRSYCNEAMDTGVIPPLPPPETSSLVQVHVAIRHGSRVKDSANKGECWDGQNATTYDCSATLLEGPLAPPSSVLPKGEVLFRKEFARGRNALPGNCGVGQLVSDGIKMQQASGAHLREAYASILPASPVGNESAFYLRSDDSARTIASGQALFGAMYPDLGAPAVVPWHTMDEGGGAETIGCWSASVCPSLRSAILKAGAAARLSPHYRDVTLPLASDLSAALNRSVSPAGIEPLLDCLMSTQCPTVPSSGGAPPASLTDALQQRAIDEATHALYSLLNDTAVSRYGAGPLLGEIVVGMEAAARGDVDSPRFVLLSGHDTGPMAPLIAALRLGGTEWPRFADLLSIELHRYPAETPESVETAARAERRQGAAGTGYAVRVVHNGKVVTGHVPGCPAADLCPFDVFHAAAASIVPTPEDCGRSDSPAWWPRPTRR